MKIIQKFEKNKYIDKDGYIIINKKINNKWKLIKEHRYIWEDYYGVNIPNGYVIHHINNIKTDNRIQNLQLISSTKHNIIHKKNISNFKIKGKNNGIHKNGPWNKGKKNCYSRETLERMSNSHKNKKITNKTRVKISKSLKNNKRGCKLSKYDIEIILYLKKYTNLKQYEIANFFNITSDTIRNNLKNTYKNIKCPKKLSTIHKQIIKEKNIIWLN